MLRRDPNLDSQFGKRKDSIRQREGNDATGDIDHPFVIEDDISDKGNYSEQDENEMSIDPEVNLVNSEHYVDIATFRDDSTRP